MTSALHPDDATLAEHLEGLLDQAEAQNVSGHLSSCAGCSEKVAVLGRLPADLAAAGEGDPLPPAVAARLDAALAAALAAERPSSAGRTVVPAERAHGGPFGDPSPRTTLGMRVLQAAAVVVLLLAGVGVVLSAIQDDSGNTVAGGSAERAGTESQQDASSEGSGDYPLTTSGRQWTEQSLQADVGQIISGALAGTTALSAPSERSRSAPAEGTDAGADGSRRLRAGPELAECVAELHGGPVTPLGVDIGQWKGQPATVIVLPAEEDVRRVWVWVVEPTCGGADAKVLYFAQLDRP